jgi:F0F1-type ATP synthase assembly protein I
MKNQQNNLENLKERINKMKTNKESGKTPSVKFTDTVAELIATFFIGAMIGYYLDKIFTSKPFFFVITCILSFISAFYNIYRNLIK